MTYGPLTMCFYEIYVLCSEEHLQMFLAASTGTECLWQKQKRLYIGERGVSADSGPVSPSLQEETDLNVDAGNGPRMEMELSAHAVYFLQILLKYWALNREMFDSHRKSHFTPKLSSFIYCKSNI